MNNNHNKTRFYYDFCRFLCWWFFILMFKVRIKNRGRVPGHGGVLLISNHQSFLDPVLAGMGLGRECHYMARDSLFRNKLFKRLIESLNAFPVKRGKADVGAIKESLRRLKRGKVVVMFPEGTRTKDGRIRSMLPGLAAVAQKARVPIVPTLIDGAYQAWPRTSNMPGTGNVLVEYGEAIYPEDYADMKPEELTRLLEQRLREMQKELHRKLPERRLYWYEDPDRK
jgi:1-acyl-sn-glycerol-3-phosphate acyltransferase